MTLPRIHNLCDAHIEDLVVRSSLSVETITLHGLHSGSEAEVHSLIGFGVGAALVIPSGEKE